MNSAYERILGAARAILGADPIEPCKVPLSGLQAWAPGPALCCPAPAFAEKWVDRCISEGKAGRTVVLLAPSHVDTGWGQRSLRSCSSVVLVAGRPNAEWSQGVMLVGWNVDLAPLSHLGVVMKP